MLVGSMLPAAGSFARADLWPEEPAAEAGQRFLPVGAERGVAGSGQGAPLVYTRLETGRRRSYLRVLERLFGARRAGRRRDLFLPRAPVLFLMVEEAFLLYVVVGLLRAMIGRRTVGLLARPRTLAVSARWRHALRRAVLHRLKRRRSIQTLTVLPFGIFPAFASIADGWIYDFQLWDLTEEERRAIEALRDERRTGERPVVSAIGTQSPEKGIDLFADVYARSAGLRSRCQFIACGRVVPAAGEHAAVLVEAGGVLVDRMLSDAELLGTYAASDAVWCLYPPVGDHASGILGRAAQLGIPVVVRQGSLAHRLCTDESLPHVAASPETVAERLAGPLPPRDAEGGHLAALRFAEKSEATLRAALGLARP
jgi:glycosyltransferase involved in cell wall biosynthesis